MGNSRELRRRSSLDLELVHGWHCSLVYNLGGCRKRKSFPPFVLFKTKLELKLEKELYELCMVLFHRNRRLCNTNITKETDTRLILAIWLSPIITQSIHPKCLDHCHFEPLPELAFYWCDMRLCACGLRIMHVQCVISRFFNFCEGSNEKTRERLTLQIILTTRLKQCKA